MIHNRGAKTRTLTRHERNRLFGEGGQAKAGGRLSLGGIDEAARFVDRVFLDSPQYEAEALGAELGLRLVC